MGILRIVKPQIPRRTQDVAAVKRGDAEISHRHGDQCTQASQPDVSHHDPQQMFDLDLTVVGQTFWRQKSVDTIQRPCLCLQSSIGCAHHPLAGAADRHDVQSERLRLRKGPGIDRQRHIGMRFRHDPGAATGRGSEFNDLDPQSADDRSRRLIEFRRRPLSRTTGVEGIFHGSTVTGDETGSV